MLRAIVPTRVVLSDISVISAAAIRPLETELFGIYFFIARLKVVKLVWRSTKRVADTKKSLFSLMWIISSS